MMLIYCPQAQTSLFCIQKPLEQTSERGRRKKKKKKKRAKKNVLMQQQMTLKP
jgi:hypothetical protein